MAMSVSGLGSNLDVAGIVSQLMEVEKQPLKALDTKEAAFQSKISAFGSVKGALSTLQNAVAGLNIPENYNPLDFFSTYSGTVADTNIASVTAGEGSVPGDYSLEVTQLAQQHRIASAFNPTITAGKLNIELGSADGTTVSKATSIDITGTSLTSVRDAINKANAGVTAVIVNGASGAQLVLTGSSEGSNQFIRLSGTTGLSYANTPASGNFSEQQTAQNALLSINGTAIQSQSNKVSDALDGVTIELKKKTEALTPTKITLTRDTSSLNKAMEKLVTAFNDFNKLSKELGGFNTATGKLGTLGGDTTLRAADGQLRQLFGSTGAGLSSASLRNLSDIGISLQRDGTLKLDSTKLNKAIAQDFVGVANVASAFAKTASKTIDGLIGSDGTVIGKTDSLKASVKSIDLRRTFLEQRLTDIEARYKKQYTALDTLVSSMLQTSNYLEQQLANLPSAS